MTSGKMIIQQNLIKILGFFHSQFDQTNNGHWRVLVVGCHLLMICLANLLAFLFRFEGIIPKENLEVGITGLPHVLLIYTAVLWIFGLFDGSWKYVGRYDLIQIIWACLTSTILSYLWIHEGLGWTLYPRSVIILTGILGIGLLGGIRLGVRWCGERAQEVNPFVRRVLVVGAGNAGEGLVRDLLANPSYGYNPVVFVDDNPQKYKMKIHGLSVAGKIAEIDYIAKKYKVDEIVIAVPSSIPKTIQNIVQACQTCLCPIKTLPNVRELLDDHVKFQYIRPLILEDLLQREPIQTNMQALHPLLGGRRVLVTGAGGSIGSELCRQIANYRPEILILFERHEFSLYAIDLELRDTFPHARIIPFLGDVTDLPRVEAVFTTYEPHIVFHAAAHKHVPLIEYNSVEGIRNNILGTKIIGEAALKNGVDRFILVSTDKAVNPKSIMGATKLVAEHLVQDLNRSGATRFVIVRFGNVLASNGSVVTLFRDQIRKGGPVTITHPRVKRYFMTIAEAVQLLLQASAQGKKGVVFVLDMGEQIYIADLARNMIRLSGFVPDRDIKLEFIGLRPGEKMCEELFDEKDILESTTHPKIKMVLTPPAANNGQLELYLREMENFFPMCDSQLLSKKLWDFVYTKNVM